MIQRELRCFDFVLHPESTTQMLPTHCPLTINSPNKAQFLPHTNVYIAIMLKTISTLHTWQEYLLQKQTWKGDRLREGNILGLQVEEDTWLLGGRLILRLRLWHCGWCFIIVASVLAAPHHTWGWIWPVKYRWCVCLCISYRFDTAVQI